MPNQLLNRLDRDARRAVTVARLLLAAKTALAVGIAWAVAPHMPGVTDDYPYYAPLGALVSMYPTLMGSARSGFQTLLGLAVGIALAGVVVVTVGPNWWSIPAVVGVGVVVSGTGWFGAGREYIPMAALFVLIIGGSQAEGFSAGYLVQMSVGVVIGLAVNFVLAPAITTASANARVDALQVRLAEHLRDIGAALRETWPPEHEQWARNADDLAATADDVRQALVEGEESKKANPRALFRRAADRGEHARLETLDTVAFHVRDITGVLADTMWQRPGALGFEADLAAPLSDACTGVAAAIAEYGSDTPEAHRALGDAARTVRHLVEDVDGVTLRTKTAMGPAVATAMHLRRILMHLQHGTQAQEA